MPNNGMWTEKVLHSFGEGNDGTGPEAGLVIDANGTYTEPPFSAALTMAAWCSS